MEEEALGEYDTRLPRKLVGPNFTVSYGKITRAEEIAAEKEKEKKEKKETRERKKRRCESRCCGRGQQHTLPGENKMDQRLRQ